MLFSEPKIPQRGGREEIGDVRGFQCSSASRKFLKLMTREGVTVPNCFSALQRAENSSIDGIQTRPVAHQAVSVLFSEPKIPQFSRGFSTICCQPVSVLFSEPKIPQLRSPTGTIRNCASVSVLFSEPKIPQFVFIAASPHSAACVSVLFSEPKIPQLPPQALSPRPTAKFQCSSASRKFLNPTRARRPS